MSVQETGEKTARLAVTRVADDVDRYWISIVTIVLSNGPAGGCGIRYTPTVMLCFRPWIFMECKSSSHFDLHPSKEWMLQPVGAIFSCNKHNLSLTGCTMQFFLFESFEFLSFANFAWSGCDIRYALTLCYSTVYSSPTFDNYSLKYQNFKELYHFEVGVR